MNHNDPFCLIIDEDREAGDALLERLLESGLDLTVYTRGNVAEATDFLLTGGIDLLFIRITQWDAYQHLMYGRRTGPGAVIFLSGAGEKGTAFLETQLDFHLQPPYPAGVLEKVHRVLLNPTFRLRPLDFFFLKHRCRTDVIRYGDLRRAVGRHTHLVIETDQEAFEIQSSLPEFERRLPIPGYRKGPRLLVFNP
jgi:hypothetical protein